MSTEEAEKEWLSAALKHRTLTSQFSSESFLLGISAFKSALREEIENWKKHESQAMYPSYYYSGRQDALNNVLQLLDSVTLKK